MPEFYLAWTARTANRERQLREAEELLVFSRGFFQMIDHNGFDRRLASVQLEPEFLHCAKDCAAAGSGGEIGRIRAGWRNGQWNAERRSLLLSDDLQIFHGKIQRDPVGPF